MPVDVAAKVPALTQSRQGLMACGLLYYHAVVLGERTESPEARRGTEVHTAISRYIAHLVQSRRMTDPEFLAELIESVGGEAAEILEGFGERETFFDPEKVLGTELQLSFDQNFYPVAPAEGLPRSPKTGEVISLSVRWSELPADVRDEILATMEGVWSGRLDLVQLETPTEAIIDDWKTQFSITDGDTFQGRFYSLLMFVLNPTIQTVRFRLQFVRYGIVREVKYTRADVPKLKREAERERQRQVELHSADPTTLTPTPGSHCLYCPLLQAGKCPLRDANPATMGAVERLAQKVWLDQQAKVNDEWLRNHVSEVGPVSFQDANGNEYQARFEVAEKTRYPLLPTVEALEDDEDVGLEVARKLYVGATELKPLLKAKKRAALAETIKAVAEITQETVFKVGKAKGGE